jgi:hypothetical protein
MKADMHRTILSLLVASSMGVLACSSSAEPSLNPTKTNCTTVCDQAQMCLNMMLTIDDCISNCDDKSSDDSYKSSVAACADCVNGKSCTDSASCPGNCLSTVTTF